LEISRADFLRLGVQRQVAAVRVFLCFFRLGIFAFQIGEGHVQRFVTEADSDRPYAGQLHLTPG
jgi:hypothetical protein